MISPPDRDPRGAAWPRPWVAALLAAATVALAGCGSQSPDASTVAHPVAPPELATASVPASHAVAPEAGGGEQPDASSSATDASATQEHRSIARAASRGILSAADRASFRRLSASLGGQQGLAVSGLGLGQRVERVGSLRTGIAWSTSKVPIAMAVIAAGGAETLGRDLKLAITASDNAAALRLWSSLGGGSAAANAADEQLRQAGDRNTRLEHRSLRGGGYTPFGQTRWALVDQTRFTAGLACLDAGAQVLGLMNDVIASQRWGLGATGMTAQLKGGWGPGSEPGVSGGYLDRQMGVITIDGTPLAVSIASRPADGSHASGTRALTAIARWLVTHANGRNVNAEPRC